MAFMNFKDSSNKKSTKSQEFSEEFVIYDSDMHDISDIIDMKS